MNDVFLNSKLFEFQERRAEYLTRPSKSVAVMSKNLMKVILEIY
ncbi:hypothetical protein [Clostridium chromiireducens]|nr:hypothetical protein [Clostridium chromiireducens]